MSRIPARVGSALACAAVLVLAGCASGPGPGTAQPDTPPDLFEALPPPTSAQVTTTTATPTPSATPPPPSRTTTPRAGRQESSGASGADSGDGGGSGKAGAVKWRAAGGDEFNGAELDPAMWNVYDSIGGFGNGFRRPEAISQSDGNLRITGKEDVSGGMGHSVGQLYGRWEFRARTEPGRGFGSAILLWPDSEQWPEDGEVDIMEVPSETRDVAHFVLHWSAEDHIDGAQVPGDFSQWHTFAVEWLPDRITWFVDGAKKYETTDKAAIPTTPMHLTIQLDRGPKKDWLAEPDETTPAEGVVLEVDWVRISAAP